MNRNRLKWLASVVGLSVIVAVFSQLTAEEGGLGDTLWAVRQDGVVRLDPWQLERRAVELPGGAALDLAADDLRRVLWVRNEAGLSRYSFSGVLLGAIDLPTDERAASDRLEVNPMDGSVWLLRHRDLLAISAGGQSLGQTPLLGDMRDVVADLAAGLIWVLGDREVAAYDSIQNIRLRSLERSGMPPVTAAAVDPAAGELWLATNDWLERYAYDGHRLAILPIPDVRWLTHGGRDYFWALTGAGIRRIARDGTTVALATPLDGGLPLIDIIAKGEHLWVTDGLSVARLDSTGRLLERTTVIGPIARLVLSPADNIPPAVRIVTPVEGDVVSAADLEVELDLSDVGMGVDPASVFVRAGQADIAFPCEVSAQLAVCRPERSLDPGQWTITAMAGDRAGNDSEPVAVSLAVVRADRRRRGAAVIMIPSVQTTLVAIADTFIARGSKWGNHGSEEIVSVQGSGSHRGLIRFELGGVVDSIERLDSARLRLLVVSNGGNWGSRGRLVTAHRLTTAWTESGATWTCPNDTEPTNSSADCAEGWRGGEFVSEETDSVLHTDSTSGWVEYDVTADVQAVIAGESNLGWILKRQGGGGGHVGYSSKENASGHPPELVLDYVEADADPPTISIHSPADGGYVSTVRPEIDLSFGDLGAGVDEASLAVRLNDGAAAVTCTAESTLATCRPVEDLADGVVSVYATIEDLAGNVSDPATSAFTVDTSPPAITVTHPPNGLLTNQTLVEVRGTLSEAATLSLNGAAVAVAEDLSFTRGTSLAEGGNTLLLTATDRAGNQASTSITVTVDTVAPAAVDTNRVSVTESTGGSSAVSGGPGAAEPGADLVATNERTRHAVAAVVEADGGFFVTLSTEPDDLILLVLTDAAGNSSVPVVVVVPEDPGPEPPVDPEDVATAIDSTVQSDISRDTAFLYEGDDLIQTGVTVGTIDSRHVAILRGRVLLRNGDPLESVTVRIVDRAEFGQTMTRMDGEYDMAVNGGGRLTVEIERDGYLTAQRTVDVPWRDYVPLEDIVMVPRSPRSTPIELAVSTAQVARGPVESDADGSRQSTAIVPPDTQATMTLADGSTQPMGSLTLRSTEYTVGSAGLLAMPGELPPTSGYTYAVELSADEADAAGAISVNFSRPLAHYIENYLGLRVGVDVPAGYYDRRMGRWVGSDNGRVIAVVSIDSGVANLDLDGSGTAADEAALAALGVTEEERVELATLYGPGQELWRVPIEHLTPWDFNFAFAPPLDAVEPPASPAAPDVDDPCLRSGSILECENQVLHERVDLAGSPWSLHYSSDRVPGRLTKRSVRITLSEDVVPDSLGGILLEVRVAGQFHRFSFPANPNQEHLFTWDGLDAYGRRLYGSVPVDVKIGYSYALEYYETLSGFSQGWAQVRGQSMSVNRLVNPNVTLWTEFRRRVLAHDPDTGSLGGWSLTAQHFFDRDGETLYLGTGARRGISAVPDVVERAAGTTDDFGATGDGGLAVDALLETPRSLAVAPDGGFCIGFTARVRCVDKDGVIRTVAGTGVYGSSGDGGPATSARLRYVNDLVLARDGTLYISDCDPSQDDRIRRVDPEGQISTVVTFVGSSNHVEGIAVGPDGRLHFSDDTQNRVMRLEENGMSTLVAGNGGGSPRGDNGPAVEAAVPNPRSLAFGSDGSLYIMSVPDQIRRIRPDGIIERFVGKWGCTDPVVDVGPAYSTCFGTQPKWVDVADDGTVFMSEGPALREIREGFIMPGPGWEAWRRSGPSPTEGAAALDVRFGNDNGLGIFPNGDLLFAENRNVVWRIRSAMRGEATGPVQIASRDGSVLYQFDLNGRHLASVDALTGVTLSTLQYDSSGRLVGIRDRDGNTTTIERDAAGLPTAIVSPFGQRTGLTTNGDGFLDSITNPAGEALRFDYAPEGLMTARVDARSAQSTFIHDPLGRLISNRGRGGATQDLSRTESNGVVAVLLTSPSDRATLYEVEERVGDELERRVTDAAALQTRTVWRPNGGRTQTLADGTVVDVEPDEDPRFGLQAPLPGSVRTTTPGGLVRTLAMSRSVGLLDPVDPLSLTSLSETLTDNGRAYSRSYDATANRITMTSPAGRTSRLDLDGLGRVEQAAIGTLALVAATFDTFGRLITLAQGTGDDARSVSLDYDATGRLSRVIDPLERPTLVEYDAANRAVGRTLPGGDSIGFDYDANGNLTVLIPPGRPTHQLGYAADDALHTYLPPEVGQGPPETTTTYDPDGRLATVTRPGADLVSFDYDAAGRLVSVTANGHTTTLAYDTAGRLATVDAGGTESLSYTYDGELPLSVTWSGEVSGAVAHAYDNSFRLLSESVNGESPLTFAYDSDSLLTRAGALTLVRDAANGFTTATSLGGVSTTRGHNEFGEVSLESASISGQEVYRAEYVRDKLGRITRKTETIQQAAADWQYTYDPSGRLSEVRKDGTPFGDYTYDGNGNRLTYTGIYGSSAGEYDAQDRLSSYGGITYSYTAAGDLATKASPSAAVSYGFDAFGGLKTVVLESGVRIEYVIDGQGRRVGKKVDDSLVQGFLYRDALRPIAELDVSGSVVARFIYADRANVPAYLEKGGSTYRIISDHLGSPRLVIDVASGAVAQRLDYDEYGRVTLDTSPGFQPFGFAGGLYDPQTRLVHFGVRDYDAEIGRWTSKDPLGFLGGDTNLYAYVLGDPINLYDSRGLYRELVHRLLTYQWARDSGFDSGQAFTIAHANQQLDRGWSSPFNPFGGVQKHFRDRRGVREALLGAIERCDFEEFGRQLHALQDSYSHEGFRWWTLGHLPVKSPDSFNPFSHRDRLMETTTRYFLGQMQSRIGR